MNLLLHIVHVFHILVIFTVINGYILFAANIEDFKTLAKKYIPERFAEKLAKFASDTSLFSNRDVRNPREDNAPRIYNNRDEITEREDNAPIIYNMPMRVVVRTGNENQSTVTVQETSTDKIVNAQGEIDTPSTRTHKNKISLQEIDIDELVDRIKEKLEKQYEDKYKSFITTKGSLGHEQEAEAVTNNNKFDQNQTPRNDQIQQDDKMPQNDEMRQNDQGPQNDKSPQNFQPPQNDQRPYNDQRVVVGLVGHRPENSQRLEHPVPHADVPQFQEKYLSNPKDSYEDYIAAAKEDPVGKDYPKKATQKKPKISTIDETDDRDYDYKIKSSELKAVTENLNYDYHHYKFDGKTSRKGTGIPTRERFSMSSPNYYASIPVKAEKYDFNEPLPEKDREHEDLKYIENPLAKINKKVLV